jgi:ribosomal protein S18 acetylase RimI-like enzyme
VDLDFHIGSLATAPAHRRRGFARLLLLCALRHAAAHGAETAFLEYRVSNHPAARLYAGLGFRQLRVRRGYYTDNGEDAIEVALPGLHQDATRARLDEDVDVWLRDHAYDVQLTDFECR